MKKRIILALALVAMLALAACGNKTTATPATPTATTAPKDDTTPTPTEAVAPTDTPFDPAAKSEGVMTYAQYAAAELDTDVVIECYVQATQSWYNDKIVVYAADPDGGYLIYSTCTINPNENENRIDAFLTAHPDFECIPFDDKLPKTLLSNPRLLLQSKEGKMTILPDEEGMDGFFIAKMRRRS